MLLFPEGAHSFEYGMTINRDEIEKSCEGMTTRHFWPELCVFIGYAYPLTAIRAHSGFIYEIRKVGGRPFELGETVALDDMTLNEHPLWGGSAT